MSKFFYKKDDQFYVAVDTLDAYIPNRYIDRGFTTIGEYVSTLGIFDIVINNTEKRVLHIPNIIYMEPKDIQQVTVDDVMYQKLSFVKDDIFMTTDTVIKDKFLIIPVFKEYFELGNIPSGINYNNIHLLLNNVNTMAEMDFNVNPVISELLVAFLTRQSDNLTKQARFDTSKPNKFISLRNIAYGPDSITSKVFGSWSKDGLRGALVNPNDESKPLEDIMRL